MSRERLVQTLAVVMLVTSLFAAASVGSYRTSLAGPEPAAVSADVPQSEAGGVVPASTPTPESPDATERVLVGYTEKRTTVQRDGRTVTVPAGTPVYAYVGAGANGTTTASGSGSSGSSGGSGTTTSDSTPEEETGAS